MRLAILLAAILVACADNLAPLEQPQPGMPCGAAWSPCSAPDGGPTGTCCPNGDICRADGTCEAGVGLVRQ